MDNPIVGIGVVLLLVLANGFFVATEFAIVAIRRSRIEELAQAGNANAIATRKVVEHLDGYIAACQFGITLASLALGWVGEPAFAHLVEPPLEAVIGQFAPAVADAVAVGVAFAIITALHIVIGELAPKGLALQKAEAVAFLIARPILFFYAIFRWPIELLNTVGNGVLRLAGLEPAAGHEMVHTVSELRLLVRGSLKAGVVEATEARIATRAFEFADHTAGALMTPRTDVEAVPITATLDELLERATTTRHNRWLVYENTLDNVVGVLHVRDLFRFARQRPRAFSVRQVVRHALVTPASKAADDLLEEMRTSRRQLAVVIDEYGGTAGIVTLEDLLAALVGRIEDEPLLGDVPPVPAVDQLGPDGTMLLDGLTRLDEFEEITGITLSEEMHEEVETVGGLIMTELGRIPEPGDEVSGNGWRLRVEELHGRRVAQVRLIVENASRTPADDTAAA